DPYRNGVRQLVRDLNTAYRTDPALWSRDTTPDGFRWIVADDEEHNVFAFARTGSGGEVVVCVVNLSGVTHEWYRVGLPVAGAGRGVINPDAEGDGGWGVGNLGSFPAQARPWHGMPASASLRLPALGALWLRPA